MKTRANRRPLRDRLLPVMGPLLLVGFWWLAAASGLLNTKLVPAPGPTLTTTLNALASGTMAHDLLQTLIRVLYAFGVAAGVGVPLGILIGANERVYRSIEFLIDFFRSTPSTAMFPLFMLIFGLGEEGKIALAAFAAFLIIVFNVAYGVLNARKTRILAARSMGASTLRIFGDVIFLETLPQRVIRTYIPLFIIVVVLLFPFYWMVITECRSRWSLSWWPRCSSAASTAWGIASWRTSTRTTSRTCTGRCSCRARSATGSTTCSC